ncbi:hypothetical protein JCM8208_006802 [Rhodotorula glutinis]
MAPTQQGMIDNLEEFEEVFQSIKFPSTDALPTKFEWVANEPLLSPELLAAYLVKVGQPPLLKTIISHVAHGSDGTIYAVRQANAQKKLFVRERNGGKVNPNLAFLLGNKPMQHGAMTQADDRKMVRIIVQLAHEHGYLSFRSLQRHISAKAQPEDMENDKDLRALVVLSLCLFYLNYSQSARFSVIRQVLAADNIEEIETKTYGEAKKYYLDPTSKYDVSCVLWQCGQRLGHDAEYFSQLMKEIGSNVYRKLNSRVVKSQAHDDATVLLEEAYLDLCETGNAPKDVYILGQKIGEATKYRDGRAADERKARGHQLAFTELEYKTLYRHLAEQTTRYQPKTAAEAVNFVSNLERTPRQVKNYVQHHCVSLALTLVQDGVSPLVVATPKRLAKGGIFSDPSAPTGYSYNETRLAAERPSVAAKIQARVSKGDQALKDVVEELDAAVAEEEAAADAAEDELAALDAQFDTATVF